MDFVDKAHMCIHYFYLNNNGDKMHDKVKNIE